MQGMIRDTPEENDWIRKTDRETDKRDTAGRTECHRKKSMVSVQVSGNKKDCRDNTGERETKCI